MSTQRIIVPGDKSITHRAILLAGIAPGRCSLSGVLTSLDAKSTARVLRALGVSIPALVPERSVEVRGRRRWTAPQGSLDCGNSGTTARLLLGMLAGQAIGARLTGDRSLRRRPMRRVTEPLSRMGARFDPPLPELLPLTIRGGRLTPMRWELPVSSAQLKSSLLLAGLVGQVPVAIKEPHGLSRDHTERLFRGLGLELADRRGWIEFVPTGPIEPFSLRVPGDPSSAAFLVGSTVLGGSRDLVVEGVGLNPTRTAYLDVLRRMGATIATRVVGHELGEPYGEIEIASSPLRATAVTASEIPGLIDEIPMLAVAAARAHGETRFDQVGELRVKESDRLGLLAANLRALGYQAEVQGDSLVVVGSDHPPTGRVRTEGDHRLVMAFGVLGGVPGARVTLDDRTAAAVSFPGFFELLRRLRR